MLPAIEEISTEEVVAPKPKMGGGINIPMPKGFKIPQGKKDGDTIDLECEGCGKLTIKVRDDLKRTWARETRLDRQQKGLKGTTPQLTGKYAKPNPAA